jgi:hypothetical protein
MVSNIKTMIPCIDPYARSKIRRHRILKVTRLSLVETMTRMVLGICKKDSNLVGRSSTKPRIKKMTTILDSWLVPTFGHRTYLDFVRVC